MSIATVPPEDFGSMVLQGFRTWTSLATVDLAVTGSLDPNLDTPNSRGALYEMLAKRTPPDVSVLLDKGNLYLELLQALGEEEPLQQVKVTRGYVFEVNVSKQNPPPGYGPMVVMVLGSVSTPGELSRVLLHEAGHSLGLAHSSVRVAQVVANAPDRASAPIMTGMVLNYDLLQDDIASISALYPSAEAKRLFGTVVGTVSDPQKRGQQGVLVRARKLEDARQYSRTHEFALLSTPATRGSLGAFSFYLPAGTYEITFEPADTRFDHAHEDGLKPADRAEIVPGSLMTVHVTGGQTAVVRGFVDLVRPVK